MEQKEEIGVYLNMKTRLRSTSGIFDYSSDQNKNFNTFITKRTYITKQENNFIKGLNNQSDKKEGDEFLFFVRYRAKIFKIENQGFLKNLEINNTNIELINKYIWYVINSEDSSFNKNEDYYLSVNDIIKLGKVKYIVKEIYIKNNLKKINEDKKPKIFKLIPNY